MADVPITLTDLAPISKDLEISPVPVSRNQQLVLDIMHKLALLDTDDDAVHSSLKLMLDSLDKLKPKDIKVRRNKEKAIFPLVRTLQVVREETYNSERNLLYPIKDEEAWKYYTEQSAVHWTPNTIDFTKDIPDFYRAPMEIKRCLLYTFGMFGHTDNNVASNCLFRFTMESETMEDTLYYSLQIKVEGVHIDSYHRYIMVLIQDYPELLDWVENAYKNVPSIRNIHRFAEKYQNSDLPKEERLLAFMCVEGILFMGPFEFFYWLRGDTSGKRRKFGFDGGCFLNQEIGKEEGGHRDRAQAKLFTGLSNGTYHLSEKRVYEIVNEASMVAREFIYDAMPKAFAGFDPDHVFNDACHLANNICRGIGFASPYPEVTGLKIEEFKTFAGNFLGSFYEVKISQYALFDPSTALKATLSLGRSKGEREIIVKEEDHYADISSEEELALDE